MTCQRCRKPLGEEEPRCPHCGEPNPNSTRLYQTSTVLISSGSDDLVYRSVEEVPVRLRTKLLKFTNGRNSATILIADRRGRREISKAMHSLPALVHRRVPAPCWLTPARKKLIMAALVLLITALVLALFLHEG